MVRFHASSKLWIGFALANLPLLWQHLEVHLKQANIILISSYSLSSLGKHALAVFILAHLYLQMPETFAAWYRNHTENVPPTDLFTHMKQELMHALWKLMLDDEFMRAYSEGVPVEFANGKTRPIVLRIFTYLADYPKK
jgi:hypothetical protein